MKSLKFILAFSFALFYVCSASAQKNIIKAFDNIINNSSFKVVPEKISSERDPKTGAKISQCDIYSFTIPNKDQSAISDVIKAFHKDEKYSYYISSGKSGPWSNDELAFAFGVNSKLLITGSECNYIIATFMAPKNEDPEGNNRYCYAFVYKEEGNNIGGSLVVTYGTTALFRQIQPQNTEPVSSGNREDGAQQSWFGRFMTYVNALPAGNYQQRSGIATKIYEMSQQIPDSVPGEDLATAQDVLNTTLNKGYEEIVQTLLKSTIKNLGVEYEKRRHSGGIYVK